MRIAIQAADLDNSRIDGTRVYLLNLLKRFGSIAPGDEFLIYHRRKFNPELQPPQLENYKIKKIKSPIFWTQIRLAYELKKDKPEALWMPMHNIPILKSSRVRTTVTIHDLAYHYFPQYFPKKDLLLLKLLGSLAISRADKLIAISESTKSDILKFYPTVREDKIKVIYHGFDPEIYLVSRDQEKEQAVLKKLGISGDYILYSGAIQPRKNLDMLIRAFELIRSAKKIDIKLVLAGEKAWLSENTCRLAATSKFCEDIILTGKLKFTDLGHLTRGARAYVFSSLYEGFGITILEAMASRVPVICSKNSSLPEVGGEAAVYFDCHNPEDIARKIETVLSDENYRNELIKKGLEQIKKFSWDKCSRQTLEWIRY